MECIRSFNYASVECDVATALEELQVAGIHKIQIETGKSAAKNFVTEVLSNLEMRFSDDVSCLCDTHDIKRKPERQTQQKLQKLLERHPLRY